MPQNPKSVRPSALASVLSLIFVLTVLSRPNVRESIVWHRDNAFARAANRGDLLTMRLLRTLGANIDSNVGYDPPIIAAASNGRTEAIRYFLENGADVDRRDKFGFTALIAAADSGHSATVRYLIGRGSNIDAASEEGSALYVVKKKGYGEIVGILQNLGAKETQ